MITWNQNKKLLIIGIFTIGYMLAGIAWWSVLLHRKIEENYALKKVMPLDLQINDAGKGNIDWPSIDEINESYAKDRIMVYGEFSVFIITLFICSWLIYSGIQKELAASRNQKNFLLSVTHELKSPITSLNLAIDTLKKPKLNDTTKLKLLKNAKEDSQRLESLVNNILFSAKLEGNYIFNFETIDLASLLRRVVDKFSVIHSSMTIAFTQDEHQNFAVKADKESLVSVFNNIIENAIKYSPDKSKITVDLSNNTDKSIVIIKDEGVGIHPDEQEAIFRKFYRVGNEETRQSKGTGLGLYIASEIIQAHKGHISVHTGKTKGSTFKIMIPKHQV